MPNEYVNNLDALRRHIDSSDLVLEHEVGIDDVDMQSEYLTLDEAADLSGKGKDTIKRWRHDGLLTKYPVRIRKEELVALLGSFQKEQPPVRSLAEDLREEVAKLKQELAVAAMREQDSRAAVEELRWANSDMSTTMNKALDSLNGMQQELKAAHGLVCDLRERHVQLEKTEILYLAECSRGFFGRLFTRPLPLSQLLGEQPT